MIPDPKLSRIPGFPVVVFFLVYLRCGGCGRKEGRRRAERECRRDLHETKKRETQDRRAR